MIAQFYRLFLLEPAYRWLGAQSEFAMYVFGTQILHLITFWIHCSFLALVDFYPSTFKSFSRWKIQPEMNNPLSMDKFIGCVKVVLFNQLIVNFITAYIAYQYIKLQGGVDISMDHFPTLTSFLYELVIFVIIEEIGFYYSHSLFHTPLLYKWIHKQHHDWIAPIGCACIYAHPIEHICSNLLPLVAGMKYTLCMCIMSMIWLWRYICVLCRPHNTQVAHIHLLVLDYYSCIYNY